MASFTNAVFLAVPVGILATLFMDALLNLRRRLWPAPALDYRMVGRWIGHVAQSRFVHDSIAKSPPISGEATIGWSAHYLTGISFAAALLVIAGQRPSVTACILIGLLTSAAPFLVMQPAMGAGIAASRTPRPVTARMNTLIAHLIFGVGLYLGSRICHAIA